MFTTIARQLCCSCALLLSVPSLAATPLPGRIEAEAYDDFFDTSPENIGGALREDAVDIETCADENGGYNVGWIDASEWLSYTIEVTQSGRYTLDTRFATPNTDRRLRYFIDDAEIIQQTLDSTGGWQQWQSQREEIYLDEGLHLFRVEFYDPEININYFDFQFSEDQEPPQEWSLVWQDEFEGDGLNSNNWNYEVNATGGGNNELQYYTDRGENSFVANGYLVLRAQRENFEGPEGQRDFTSARINSRNKADFRYGRFEIRARLPEGQGIWPAVWMMPTDDIYGGWAASGEIDIMEAVNTGVNGNNSVHGTLHYGGAWPNNTYSGAAYIPATSVSDNFHIYALEWEENEFRWFVDGVHYQTQNTWSTQGVAYPAPFDQRFHFILNVAVGGNWPGNPSATTRFPQSMEVDYIRVYKKEASTVSQVHVVASNDGVVNSDDGFIQCGNQCSHSYDTATTVSVLASANPGFIFSHWSAPLDCEGRQDPRCEFTLTSDAHDIQIHPVFVPDNSCQTTTPYPSVAAHIPGRIEAEHYDRGCPGVAYLDTDVENVGGAFRDDEVDIEAAADIGGGFNVGWLRDGEWLKYTVNVQQSGTYDLHFRVASDGNGSVVRLSLGAEPISAAITLPNTGGWQNWQTVTHPAVYLEQGIQTLTLHIDDGDLNVNFIDATPASQGPFTVDRSRGEWTLLVVPDTQHYSQNRPNAPIAHMRSAFDWIVSVKDSLNIQFVQGLGDITENWNARWEWDNSTSAWDKLYGNVAFMPIIGNHDDPVTMNQYFPVSSFSDNAWYAGDFGSIENNFALMTIGSEDYLFLHVETYDQYSAYRPEGIAWARSVLSAHPNRKVILATHDTWATDHIRTQLLSNYDNIVLSNAGHVCQREAHYETSGPRGGISHNFITDYQCDAQEVMRLRYYIFKPMEDRVEYFTYSPILNEFEVDDSSQGSFYLYQEDPR